MILVLFAMDSSAAGAEGPVRARIGPYNFFARRLSEIPGDCRVCRSMPAAYARFPQLAGSDWPNNRHRYYVALGLPRETSDAGPALQSGPAVETGVRTNLIKGDAGGGGIDP